MADTKVTALTENTLPLSTDMLYLVDDPGGSPASQKVAASKFFDIGICNGRLTLETGVPISTSDQTAKTTLYFTPYKGNRIGLYDGSAAWTVMSFAELSLSLSGYTADKNYDIWAYNDAGSVALDSTIWTNDTTRATALVLQDGIYVKTGATDRRYLGTIRITAVTGQTESSAAKRYVWNYYNRLQRSLGVFDTTDTWTYTTATWRSANNSAANRVQYVIGIAEELINLRVDCPVYTAGATTNNAYVGLALDATNTNNASIKLYAAGNGAINTASSIYNFYSAVGYHYVQWTEYSNTTGAGANGVYYGDAGGTITQSGITGWLMG